MHPTRSMILRASMLFVLLLLSACSEVATRPGAAQQDAAEHAAQLERDGHYEQAARAWVALASQYRADRDQYFLHGAESYRQLDDWDAATPLLDAVRRGRLDSSAATHFDLLRAEAALNHEDASAAVTLSCPIGATTGTWQLRALELCARAEAADGQPLAAARTRLQMDPALSGFDREQNQQQLMQLLEGMDTAELKSGADGMDPRDPLHAWIAEALERKGSGLARDLPQLETPVGTLLPGHGNAVSAEGYAPPRQVALLLPVSGPLQAAGLAVQDGFNTAWKANHDQSAQMHLETYDSGGSAAGALRGYEQAVAAGAQLVVGPLAPDAVAALFQQAPLQVPVLALNQPSQGLPPEGSAQFALPPEAEGAQVAARMGARNLHEAVLFLADGDWAQRAARAFRAQFESQGGRILGTATLLENEVNYSTAIEALMANAGANTGVFIAMAPRQARLLVPQLRIARVDQPLFATSHVFGVETNPGLDRDLDGVEFCDAPWLFNAQPGLPRRSTLAEDDPNAQGPAARLFAFGMDAWALMPYLDWLREHPGSYLSGATGQLTMDNFGRIHRTPVWLRFVNGIAVPVTGALENENSDASPFE